MSESTRMGSDLTPRHITIVADADLVVRVHEFEDTVKQSKPPISKYVVDFHVKRDVVSGMSDFFEALITTRHFSEAHQHIVELKDVKANVIRVVFDVFHGHKAFRDLELTELWDLASIANQYCISPRRFKEWFGNWYNIHGKTSSYESLLYPCYVFDHAQGFMDASEAVVYSTVGHAKESNPSKHHRLHLPIGVAQQLNAAKGRLKTELHKALYVPIDELLGKSCSCKEITTFDYQKALQDAGAWPLERVCLRSCMDDVLSSLKSFPEHHKEQRAKRCVDANAVAETSLMALPERCDYRAEKSPPTKATAAKESDRCSACSQDYDAIVARARSHVLDYFDGLCLDCIDISQPKFKDSDVDYWMHDARKQWDADCRVTHGQPTWYFSFCGRRERMNLRNQQQYEKRRREY